MSLFSSIILNHEASNAVGFLFQKDCQIMKRSSQSYKIKNSHTTDWGNSCKNKCLSVLSVTKTAVFFVVILCCLRQLQRSDVFISRLHFFKLNHSAKWEEAL